MERIEAICYDRPGWSWQVLSLYREPGSVFKEVEFLSF